MRPVEDTGERETVYNFEVADFHAYFVGDCGIWAHKTLRMSSGKSKNGTTWSEWRYQSSETDGYGLFQISRLQFDVRIVAGRPTGPADAFVPDSMVTPIAFPMADPRGTPPLWSAPMVNTASFFAGFTTGAAMGFAFTAAATLSAHLAITIGVGLAGAAIYSLATGGWALSVAATINLGALASVASSSASPQPPPPPSSK